MFETLNKLHVHSKIEGTDRNTCFKGSFWLYLPGLEDSR